MPTDQEQGGRRFKRASQSRTPDRQPKAPEPRKRVGEIFKELSREQLSQGVFFFRGTLKQQKQLLGADKSLNLFQRSMDGWSRARERAQEVRARGPAPAPDFEAVVANYKVSEHALNQKRENHQTLQLVLYFFAGLILAYSYYVALGAKPLIAIPSFTTAVSLAVGGYINGYRAWQIKHRRFIPFSAALKIRSTYLVL